MSFVSLEFALFLVVVWCLYGMLPHRGQNVMLLIASYFFYGYWDWRFLGLIAFSTAVDFFVALAMDKAEPARRRIWLTVSLVSNLGLLGVFKYYNFFADSAEELARSFGMQLSWTTEYIVLPVGISFYTFQTLSYTIDVYRGGLKPTRNALDFALFVSFFPQLVAGPIERATALLPQIQEPRKFDYDQVTRGLFLILVGIFKKVAIADGVAGSVNAIYSSPSANSLDIVLASYLFALQIYCDFSGYSDVARGVCKTMGFELMNNFDQPYIAANPQEFWRRWHISLSTWLRDYLYIGLGGNRATTSVVYRNLMLTMVLGGLWHGAAWNFVLWGVFHGGILCIHRIATGRSKRNKQRSHVTVILQALLFFQITCYGWLLFRANSLQQVESFTWTLLTGWTQVGASNLPRPPLAAMAGLGVLGLLWLGRYLEGTPRFYRKLPEFGRAGLVVSMLFCTLMGLSAEPVQFIYFQF